MDFDRLDKIYSDIIAEISKPEVDFLNFIAFKAYGLSEGDIKKYAQANELNPNTVRLWKRKFESQRLIIHGVSESWNYVEMFSPRCFFPFAFHLVRNESKRLYEFERFGLTQRKQRDFLWSIVYRIADGESRIAEESCKIGYWPQEQVTEYLFMIMRYCT